MSRTPAAETRDKRNARRRARYAADREELERRRNSVWTGDRHTVNVLGHRVPMGWVALVTIVVWVGFVLLFGYGVPD